MAHIQTINVSRLVSFGPNAISRLPNVFHELGIKKIRIFSGQTHTKRITERMIIPLVQETPNSIEFSHTALPETIKLSQLHSLASSISTDRTTFLMAVGGGKVIDYVKIIAGMANTEYIAVPTNASHDGFSSPYINYILREQISRSKSKEKPIELKPISPLAIVGDTTLISGAPKGSLTAGVGDILSKWVAVRDWRLAQRLKGVSFDIYAATFSEMTATMVEEGIKSLGRQFFSEQGVRVLMKALGSSGVAMCIAGSSRPASGSEHLVSHALDKLAPKYDFTLAHGHQTGLSSILMMYLHGGNWKRISRILKEVNAPATLQDLGIDRDILLEALTMAHNIRPDRYTILSEGLTHQAAVNAIEMTGID
ncbi:MAG: iron-containing alcohol dehydrogenase [Candidatus Heimdallarchaeota archaeon]